MRSTTYVVSRAPAAPWPVPFPGGFVLTRVNAAAPPSKRAVAEQAMRSAGEDSGLVEQRLAHGDEFFGWVADGHVVSFGWASYRDRAIEPVPLQDAIGRVFLYNFHTLQSYRGRGLYSALLLAIRSELGHERTTDFVVDAAESNPSSVIGIQKAGFTRVALLRVVTVFGRWRWGTPPSLLVGSARELF